MGSEGVENLKSERLKSGDLEVEAWRLSGREGNGGSSMASGRCVASLLWYGCVDVKGAWCMVFGRRKCTFRDQQGNVLCCFKVILKI